jgi:hypothetical protein
MPEADDAARWSFSASDVLLQLAVFAADHAVGSLAPSAGDPPPMTPFLASVAGGRPSLTRFASAEEIPGVARARQAARALPETTDAYAIAADAWVTVGGERDNAIVVECAERGADAGLILAQRYEPATATAPAKATGNPMFVGEAEQLLPGRPEFGAGLGYGAFVYLPAGAGATLDQAAERLTAAFPGAEVVREQARLLLSLGGWHLSVGLVAGPRVAAEAAAVAGRVAADDPGAASFGGAPDTGQAPWNTRFEVRTEPDLDMEHFNDYLVAAESLAEAYGGEVVDRATYPV